MTSKRVLIVDDDFDFAHSIAMRCRSVCLDVETASNPLTAFTIIGVCPPDVICLDVNMPTGNGLDICEFLTKDSVASRIPIVVLTGKKDQETIRRCHELQAYHVHKSGDVWRRLRPVFEELLDVALDEHSNVMA